MWSERWIRQRAHAHSQLTPRGWHVILPRQRLELWFNDTAEWQAHRWGDIAEYADNMEQLYTINNNNTKEHDDQKQQEEEPNKI